MLKHATTYAGLDIGTFSLKVVLLAREPKDSVPTLIGFDLREIGRGVIGEVVKASFAKIGSTPKAINISLSGPDVICRFLEFPKMNDRELESAVSFEVERQLPLKLNEMIFDYEIVEAKGATDKMGILLAAAKKGLVEERVTSLKEAGITPSLIDVDSFALTNIFNAASSLSSKESAERIVSLINIGETSTLLNILKGNELLFTREIGLAGKGITEEISRKLGVDLSAALKMKHQPPAKGGTEVEGVIRSVLGDLIEEVKLSFEYCENQYGHGVDEVYISGGTSKADLVADSFKEWLGIPINRWDPFAGMKIAPGVSKEKLKTISAELAVAAGLALRTE